jgi:hypothetical protein
MKKYEMKKKAVEMENGDFQSLKEKLNNSQLKIQK